MISKPHPNHGKTKSVRNQKTKCDFQTEKRNVQQKSIQAMKLGCFFVELIEQRPVYFFLFLPCRFKTRLNMLLHTNGKGSQLFHIFERVKERIII